MFHLKYSLIYSILIITMASTIDPLTLEELTAPNSTSELMTIGASPNLINELTTTDNRTSTTQTSTNLTVTATTKKPIIIQDATFEQIIPEVTVNNPNETSQEVEDPQQSNTQPQFPLQYLQQSNTQPQYPLQYPQQSNTQPQYPLQYPQNPYSSQYNPYSYYSAPQYQFAQYPLQAAVPQYPAIQYPPPVNPVPQYQSLPQPQEEPKPKDSYLVTSPLMSLVHAFNDLLSFVENSDSISPKLNVGIENLLPGDLKEYKESLASPISGRSLPNEKEVSHKKSKKHEKKYVDKENKDGYPVTMFDEESEHSSKKHVHKDEETEHFSNKHVRKDEETEHSSNKHVRKNEENEHSSNKRHQSDENLLLTYLKPGQILHKHTYYSIEESQPSLSSNGMQPLQLPYTYFYIPNYSDQQKFVIP